MSRRIDIIGRILKRIVIVERGHDTPCWEWTGPRDAEGYGRIRRRRSEGLGTRLVHRVVYEALVGPIAPRLEIDHLCRNRACCNGHEYTPANIIIKQPHNRRGCRECDRRRVRAYMQARKAAA